MSSQNKFSYLSAKDAAALDADLMDMNQSDNQIVYGFSVDQLMELAGMSCAQAIHETYTAGKSNNQSILILVGPGNNGGDGLVAARHLMHFAQSSDRTINRSITVVYPIKPKKDLYKKLLAQVKHLGVKVVGIPSHDQSSTDELTKLDFSSFDLLIDAIFGFSFDPKDGIRQPYKDLIDQMVQASNKQTNAPKVIAIDIPSGWHVDDGDVLNLGLKPDMLISLTAPKPAAAKFTGRYHVIGGRFVPASIRDKYHLQLPKYEGTKQYILIDQSQSQLKS